MTRISTYTGKWFDLAAPRAEQVDIRDIAHHISILGRFTGATRSLYSVAEHSLIVHDLMVADGLHPELCLAGLMHDGHEAYIGDLSSPIKQILGATWRVVEDRIQDVVMRALEVHWDQAVAALVKRYDMVARRSEAHALMESRGMDWEWDDDTPLVKDVGIVPYLPKAAEAMFLSVYSKYRSLRPRLDTALVR